MKHGAVFVHCVVICLSQPTILDEFHGFYNYCICNYKEHHKINWAQELKRFRCCWLIICTFLAGCTVQSAKQIGRKKKESSRFTAELHCGPDREIFIMACQEFESQAFQYLRICRTFLCVIANLIPTTIRCSTLPSIPVLDPRPIVMWPESRKCLASWTFC